MNSRPFFYALALMSLLAACGGGEEQDTVIPGLKVTSSLQAIPSKSEE